MKLASFVAEGKDCFGAVVGDGVITLSGKLGFATLRDALTARDGLAAMRQAVQSAPGRTASSPTSGSCR